MRNIVLLFVVSLQVLLLTAPGCLSSRASWQEETETDGSEGNLLGSPADMCSLLRCPGLRDKDRRACQLRKCTHFLSAAEMAEAAQAEVEQEEDEGGIGACAQRRCVGRRGISLRACAAARCSGAGSAGRGRENVVGDVNTNNYPHKLSGNNDNDNGGNSNKRAHGLAGLWPDEFETRAVADRRAALWPDEYETRNVELKRAQQDGRPEVEEVNRALVRRARSESETEGESKSVLEQHKSRIQKRWSTRLCMESHCKNAHSKVQYFMCGKAYCHR